MTVNVFEGSRRIALLAAALATVGTAIALLTSDPYLSVDYSIARPLGAFQKMDGSCPREAGKHYFTFTSRHGKRISIDLCLLTMPFGAKSDQLIPYKIDEKGIIWGAQTYSSEVSDYEAQLEKRFTLPRTEEEAIERELSRRHWKDVREGVGYLAIGLVIFWGFVWVIGWIVRGFLGIPRGMDKRPK